MRTERVRATHHAAGVASASIGTAAGWDPEFGRDLPLHFVNSCLDPSTASDDLSR